MKSDMYVRIDALGKVGLPAESVMRGISMALTELGTAMALQLIHGRERGLARYYELGGNVRFTSYGDPFIPVSRRRGLVAGKVNWRIWQKVTDAQLRTGRGSVLGPDTTRRTRWWELTLECGDKTERNAAYQRERSHGDKWDPRVAEDLLPPPKRVVCETCSSAVRSSAAKVRQAVGA